MGSRAARSMQGKYLNHCAILLGPRKGFKTRGNRCTKVKKYIPCLQGTRLHWVEWRNHRTRKMTTSHHSLALESVKGQGRENASSLQGNLSRGSLGISLEAWASGSQFYTEEAWAFWVVLESEGEAIP